MWVLLGLVVLMFMGNAAAVIHCFRQRRHALEELKLDDLIRSQGSAAGYQASDDEAQVELDELPHRPTHDLAHRDKADDNDDDGPPPDQEAVPLVAVGQSKAPAALATPTHLGRATDLDTPHGVMTRVEV
jgi:hypothetical protein